MFDIAWSELALIGAVALVVIGPKDLPRVMRTMGQWTRKARLLAGEFQRNFDDMVRQAELDDMRKQVQAVNPAQMRRHVETLVGADGIREAFKVEPGAPAAMAADAAEVPAPAEAQAGDDPAALPSRSRAEPPAAASPAEDRKL